MPHESKVPEPLLAGRRALESISGVELLTDWEWSTNLSKWFLLCRLVINDVAEGLIPSCSDWYVLVDESYPWGEIAFYPARKGGLAVTFPHQRYNAPGGAELPWREGKLCLDTGISSLGRRHLDIEPFDMHSRLAWHFQRALEWLGAAARNELLLPGDPYELPDFPVSSLDVFGFCENQTSFGRWLAVPENFGFADVVQFGGDPGIFYVKAFRTTDGRMVFSPQWGLVFGSSGNCTTGVWLRLPEAPVLVAAHAAGSWGELREVIRRYGIELHEVLKKTVRPLRDGRSHLLLLGWPVPERVGQEPAQLHWQALRLPALSHGRQHAKGFRPNETGYWQRDVTEVLRDQNRVEWVRSQNWDLGQVSTRGRFGSALAGSCVLLLGAGALGSAVAEVLVRGGVVRLRVMDGEIIEMANLVRHTLQMTDIGKSKAARLALRLNLSHPHAEVLGFGQAFPPASRELAKEVELCDIVIDCTGVDKTLHQLATYQWESPKTFVSISLGLGCRRCFVFSCVGKKFPQEVFHQMMDPWLRKEIEEHRGEELPWEGIGCWHPVFPGRVDDVWLFAAVSAKILDEIVGDGGAGCTLRVFEQRFEGGSLAGLELVAEVAGNEAI